MITFPAVVEDKMIRFKNYDISSFINALKLAKTLGHMYYRDKLLEVLKNSNIHI